MVPPISKTYYLAVVDFDRKVLRSKRVTFVPKLRIISYLIAEKKNNNCPSGGYKYIEASRDELRIRLKRVDYKKRLFRGLSDYFYLPCEEIALGRGFVRIIDRVISELVFDRCLIALSKTPAIAIEKFMSDFRHKTRPMGQLKGARWPTLSKLVAEALASIK